MTEETIEALASGEPDPNAACLNTDRHLWPIVSEEQWPDTIFVTAGGGIGINCGGYVIVKPLKEWHALAAKDLPKPGPKE